MYNRLLDDWCVYILYCVLLITKYLFMLNIIGGAVESSTSNLNGLSCEGNAKNEPN